MIKISGSVLIACAVIFGWALVGVAAADQGVTQAEREARCLALSRADFSSVPDAPTQIMTARIVTATGQIPPHCAVEGYVTPTVGFSMMLPVSAWNGKFIERGCGGDCGSSDLNRSELAIHQCTGPLRRGYACIITDMGHKGGGGLWAYNNLQTHIDFGYRGAHVTALAGKAITEWYYGQPPKYSYFTGCSGGGQQALSEAQRFPWDFNGIAGGAPSINDTGSTMQKVWTDVVLSGPDGNPFLSRTDLRLVHDAALKACDQDDGVKDGVIGNPLACRFDLGELLCKAGKTPDCLTEAQVQAVKKVYAGPMNSKGEKLYTGGMPIGTELDWEGASLSHGDGNARYFRYAVLPAAGPYWQEKDFDFDRDYQRFAGGAQESLSKATNPDLRKFKAAGGKLLMYQGGNDTGEVQANIIDYYETVEKTMGGRAATQDFARLFVVPGMSHCSGGKGAFAVDYLNYLESWVEQGKAPQAMIGAHVNDAYLAAAALPSNLPFDVSHMTPEMRAYFAALFVDLPLDPAIPVDFTRPIYPYPLQAMYRGTGDVNAASSFKSLSR